MKSQSIPAIYIELKPSFIILGCYVTISMLSILSVLLVALPLWLKACLLITMIIATIYIIMRDVLLCLPWSWQIVQVSSKGKLTLVNHQHKTFEPMLKNSTVNYPVLTVLNFYRTKLDLGYRSALVLTHFQVKDQQQYRRFRVWLKWWRHTDLAAEIALDT